jgi:hypothetical protein
MKVQAITVFAIFHRIVTEQTHTLEEGDLVAN